MLVYFRIHQTSMFLLKTILPRCFLVKAKAKANQNCRLGTTIEGHFCIRFSCSGTRFRSFGINQTVNSDDKIRTDRNVKSFRLCLKSKSYLRTAMRGRGRPGRTVSSPPPS